MRIWLHLGMLCLCAVMAVWAYTMSGKTRATELEVASIKREINKERERLAVLKAEWAYLNRPERLRYLVTMNNHKLRLVPINEDSYARISELSLITNHELSNLSAIDQNLLETVVIELERKDLGRELGGAQ